MKRVISMLAVLGLTGLFSVSSFADEAKGPERAAKGVVDTVTAPGQIVEGVSEDTKKDGATGVVTGTVKGTAKAAGQAVEGAANVGVGAVETVTAPLTGDK